MLFFRGCLFSSYNNWHLHDWNQSLCYGFYDSFSLCFFLLLYYSFTLLCFYSTILLLYFPLLHYAFTLLSFDSTILLLYCAFTLRVFDSTFLLFYYFLTLPFLDSTFRLLHYSFCFIFLLLYYSLTLRSRSHIGSFSTELLLIMCILYTICLIDIRYVSLFRFMYKWW